MSTPDVGVVIVAAGTGSRAGSAELKQFRWVAGKPMLLHSLQAFQERSDVAMVVCVLPREYVGDPPPWIFQCDTGRLLLSVGGRERRDSVENGLEDLPEECGIVLVHDAARPFVTARAIDDVIAAARAGHAAVPVLPVSDTLKRMSADGCVAETMSRDSVVAAQTPQGFPRKLIEDVYRRTAGRPATDDASLCEMLGIPVRTVAGDARAMKITTDPDFAVAEALSILPP